MTASLKDPSESSTNLTIGLLDKLNTTHHANEKKNVTVLKTIDMGVMITDL